MVAETALCSMVILFPNETALYLFWQTLKQYCHFPDSPVIVVKRLSTLWPSRSYASYLNSNGILYYYVIIKIAFIVKKWGMKAWWSDDTSITCSRQWCSEACVKTVTPYFTFSDAWPTSSGARLIVPLYGLAVDHRSREFYAQPSDCYQLLFHFLTITSYSLKSIGSATNGYPLLISKRPLNFTFFILQVKLNNLQSHLITLYHNFYITALNVINY